ncbi:MAG: hypothetical protein KDB21_13785 [Acidimicrobiales bacterium]|nr:hypothetical protein [Acidimicrobiales bacterium]
MRAPVPDEALAYLAAHRTFDRDISMSEVGAIVLAEPSSLAVRDFWVDGGGRDWPADPHRHHAGYYVVPGIDLVRAVDGYDPDGVLIWIPALRSFGTWDLDHWDLIVFEDTSWEAIADDPVPFLDALWDPRCPFDYLQPWVAGFEWREGRPF